MDELKYTILNCSEPFIIKNKLHWKILNWTLHDWERVLGNEEMEFRCGTKAITKMPQWERTTKTLKTDFRSFLSMKNSPDSWMYYDYKYLKDCLTDEIKEEINWSPFGFPDIKAEDSTIWIGSDGAHTSCHQDTYGCNLVAQIYGKKQWLLFPPNEDLKSSRIPYEESSIYSKLNFFSPYDLKEIQQINECRAVLLTPGDVLCVPKKWWHYVENIGTAISINTWLPLPQDDEARLEESIVQLLISQIVKDLGDEDKETVLNPNSSIISPYECFKTISNCKKNCKINQSQPKSEFNMEDLNFIEQIPKLSKEEFLNFLLEQKNRFNNVKNDGEDSEICDIISAITDPEVIDLIKRKLFK